MYSPVTLPSLTYTAVNTCFFLYVHMKSGFSNCLQKCWKDPVLAGSPHCQALLESIMAARSSLERYKIPETL